MSKQIADFLVELSKNPLLADHFKKDRLQAIAEAGFTGREAELLRISDVDTWRDNFTEIRLQDGLEPNGEAFDGGEPNGIFEESVPMGGGKKPPKARKKKKVSKKPAKKISKKPMKKPAKKKKGGRK